MDNSWFKNKKKVKTKIPLLLYFGRFRKEKGIYSLIDLIEKLNIDIISLPMKINH